MCLACEHLGEYQRALVRGVVRTLESRDPRAVCDAYFKADGFCLPRPRLALGVVDDRATAKSLAEHFLKGIQASATELGRVVAPSTNTSSASAENIPSGLMRAVERFAGRLGT
jgi:hypothetical protein